MKYTRIILSAAVLIILQACNIIEYHPYDTRIEGETGLTDKNIRLIEEKTRGKQAFRFAMISDTQRRYDETEELVAAINAHDDIESFNNIRLESAAFFCI